VFEGMPFGWISADTTEATAAGGTVSREMVSRYRTHDRPRVHFFVIVFSPGPEVITASPRTNKPWIIHRLAGGRFRVHAGGGLSRLLRHDWAPWAIRVSLEERGLRPGRHARRCRRGSNVGTKSRRLLFHRSGRWRHR